MNKKVNEKIIETNTYKKNSKEFKLIEFINNYPLLIIEESINSISQKLTINTSTLTRIIRRIGYKNYASFRKFVVEKVTENKKYLLMKEEVNKTDNTLKNFSVFSNMIIEQTFSNIEEKKIELMIAEIVCAKRVLLFGIGFSHSICHQLCKYFEVFNINSYNISDLYHALCLAENSDKNDVWIIISTSLTTKEIVLLLKDLTFNNRNKIIVITSNNKHVMLKNVFYTLKLKLPDNLKNELLTFCNKVALTAVANLLINSVINKINYNKVKQILEYKEKTTKWKK